MKIRTLLLIIVCSILRGTVLFSFADLPLFSAGPCAESLALLDTRPGDRVLADGRSSFLEDQTEGFRKPARRYQDPNRSVARNIVLNLIPGFGLGSFLQGDQFFFLLQATFESGAVVGYIVSSLMIFTTAFGQLSNPLAVGLAILSCSGVVHAASFVIGIVRPIIFKKKQQQKLSFTLDAYPYNVSNNIIAASISLGVDYRW